MTSGRARRTPATLAMLARTRPLALLIVVLAATAGAPDARAASASPQPVVRVTRDPAATVLLGQQVRVEVLVLVPNFFTAAPRFPELDAPGATVVLLDDAVNANETIDGTSYAGIQRSYSVTPEQPGEITLPAARVTFEYAAEPGKPGVAGSVEIPAQSFTAQAPGGTVATGDAAPAVAAPVAQVTVEQSLDRTPDGLAVGDALTRTVTAFASNAPAMTIPQPTFTAPDGIRVYARDPVLADVGARDGAAGGRRIDRVTYVFEKPGSFTLPAVEIAWIDPADRQRKVAHADPITLTVAAAPRSGTAIPPAAPAPGASDDTHAPSRLAVGTRVLLPWLLAGALLAAAAVLAWRRYADRIRTRLAERRRVAALSEDAFFARVEAACRAGEPEAAYRAVSDWARHAGWASLGALCASRAELAVPVTALEDRLYGRGDRPEAWSGAALLDAVGEVRAARSKSEHETRPHGVVLPALNP